MNSMTMKNMWSLHVDEAIVADRIRKALRKDCEVFFPVNSQLKDVDLIVHNLKNHTTKTVQVKSSKSWKSDGCEYSGQKVPIEKINPKKVDFFIFSCYFEQITRNGAAIETCCVVIPTKKLLEIVKKNKVVKNGICGFSFNLYKKYLGDYGDLKPHIDGNEGIDFSKYWDNFELLKK